MLLPCLPVEEMEWESRDGRGGSWEGDVWKLPSVFVALCAMSVSSLLGGNVVAVSLLWRQVFSWASYSRGSLHHSGPCWLLASPAAFCGEWDAAGLRGLWQFHSPLKSWRGPGGAGQGPLLSRASLLHGPQALHSALSVPDEWQRGDWEPDTGGEPVCRWGDSATPP